MNEEITGVNDAIVDEIPGQVAAEQEDDVVTIEELLDNSSEPSPEPEKGEQQQEDAPKAEQSDADSRATVEQAQQIARERENNAFAKRLAAEKRKFENDPVYQLGRELAAQHGGDAAKALEAMKARQAEDLAKDPAALAKYVVNQRFAPVSPPSVPEPADNGGIETDDQRARRITDDLRNVLGEGAPVKEYIKIDPDFIKNCDLYGAAAAVAAMARKATAQNQAAAKHEQNNRLPQSIRPSNNARPKPVDFSTMSDAEFRAFEEKARKARMDGKKITFR